MKTITTITRITNDSFIKESKKTDGTTFSRKLDKGSVDYSNACSNFHMKNVSIEIGNFITLQH